MTIQYTVFNKNTGRICKIGGCPDEEFKLMPPDDDHDVLMGIYFPHQWYIKDGTPTHRMEMLVSIENGTIKNVPEGSTFWIKELGNFQDTLLEDATFYVKDSGVYHIIIKHDHYLDKEVTLEVE